MNDYERVMDILVLFAFFYLMVTAPNSSQMFLFAGLFGAGLLAVGYDLYRKAQ